ncbi:uncharacterized protein RAG0_09834 [Rhynchosporium agropyri]|uniref:Transmembrane protein n=1 Tax=Rhynchosporium agropyri TaxID=914238 RepID=A0A1E1KX88_9HELO|nr:uncharacterized protein RAG0_09834 [Rhynchosporium agropyri]
MLPPIKVYTYIKPIIRAPDRDWKPTASTKRKWITDLDKIQMFLWGLNRRPGDIIEVQIHVCSGCAPMKAYEASKSRLGPQRFRVDWGWTDDDVDLHEKMLMRQRENWDWQGECQGDAVEKGLEGDEEPFDELAEPRTHYRNETETTSMGVCLPSSRPSDWNFRTGQCTPIGSDTQWAEVDWAGLLNPTVFTVLAEDSDATKILSDKVNSAVHDFSASLSHVCTRVEKIFAQMSTLFPTSSAQNAATLSQSSIVEPSSQSLATASTLQPVQVSTDGLALSKRDPNDPTELFTAVAAHALPTPPSLPFASQEYAHSESGPPTSHDLMNVKTIEVSQTGAWKIIGDSFGNHPTGSEPTSLDLDDDVKIKPELRRRESTDQSEGIEVNTSESSKVTSTVPNTNDSPAVPGLRLQVESKASVLKRSWDFNYNDDWEWAHCWTGQIEWASCIKQPRYQLFKKIRRLIREAYYSQFPGLRNLTQSRLFKKWLQRRTVVDGRNVVEVPENIASKPSTALTDASHCSRLDDIGELPTVDDPVCDAHKYSRYPSIDKGDQDRGFATASSGASTLQCTNPFAVLIFFLVIYLFFSRRTVHVFSPRAEIQSVHPAVLTADLNQDPNDDNKDMDSADPEDSEPFQRDSQVYKRQVTTIRYKDLSRLVPGLRPETEKYPKGRRWSV